MLKHIGIFASKPKPPEVPTDPVVQAQNITVSALTVGTVPTVSYDFFSSLGLLEDNQPPYAESARIAGTLTVGQTLTASFFNLVIPNGKPAGSHVYRWYRTSDKLQSLEELIVGSTGSTHLLTELDAGSHIRVEIDPVQTGGLNLVGETATSLHTGVIASLVFHPITSIAWDNAFMLPDLSRFDDLTYWANRGALSGNTVAEGSPPVYDEDERALRFTRASNNHFLFPKRNPTWVRPLDIWIRFKPAVLFNNMKLLSFNSQLSIGISSTGAITVSGGSTPGSLISPGNWYRVRIIHDGNTTSVQINGGTIYTLTGVSIASIGTGNARFGSDFSQNNCFDGWVSHFFVAGTPINNTLRDNMWDWQWNSIL